MFPVEPEIKVFSVFFLVFFPRPTEHLSDAPTPQRRPFAARKPLPIFFKDAEFVP